jgi:hypothetical protein
MSACADTNHSREAYPHTPTAYQTDLNSEAHDAGTHTTVVVAYQVASD